MLRAIPLTRIAAPRRRRPVHWLIAAWSLHRQRTRLGRLDARALRDVGIPPADARKEAARPVWDAPEGWRR